MTTESKQKCSKCERIRKHPDTHSYYCSKSGKIIFDITGYRGCNSFKETDKNKVEQ